MYLYTLIMLFVIVYTGEHYMVDLIAGGVLAFACFLAALRMRGKNRAVKEAKNNLKSILEPGRAPKSLIKGLIILLIGISIGSFNKHQFIYHSGRYKPYVPRYIDFIKNEGTYQNNYLVQIYLGHHYCYKGDERKALRHFELALSLSESEEQKKKAQGGILRCKRILEEK